MMFSTVGKSLFEFMSSGYTKRKSPVLGFSIVGMHGAWQAQPQPWATSRPLLRLKTNHPIGQLEFRLADIQCQVIDTGTPLNVSLGRLDKG